MLPIWRSVRPFLSRYGQYRCAKPRLSSAMSTTPSTSGQLQMTPEEEKSALHVFNLASETDLKLMRFSERDRTLLMAARAERGEFESFDDLSNIEGLHDSSVLRAFKNVLVSKTGKKKVSKQNPLKLQPSLDQKKLQKIETFVAIDCSYEIVSWIGMNRDGVVTGLGTVPVHIKNSSGSYFMDYHIKLLEILDSLPKADLFLMEKYRYRQQKRQFKETETRLMQQTILQATLTCLLNQGVKSSAEYRLCLFNMMSVAQYHKLLIGGEMVGTESHAEKLIHRTGSVTDDNSILVPHWFKEPLLKLKRDTYKLTECLLALNAFYKCYIASQFHTEEKHVMEEQKKKC